MSLNPVNPVKERSQTPRSQNTELRKALNVAKKEGASILSRPFAYFVVKKNDAQETTKVKDCITDSYSPLTHEENKNQLN